MEGPLSDSPRYREVLITELFFRAVFVATLIQSIGWRNPILIN